MSLERRGARERTYHVVARLFTSGLLNVGIQVASYALLANPYLLTTDGTLALDAQQLQAMRTILSQKFEPSAWVGWYRLALPVHLPTHSCPHPSSVHLLIHRTNSIPSPDSPPATLVGPTRLGPGSFSFASQNSWCRS